MAEFRKGSMIQRRLDGLWGFLGLKHIGIYVGDGRVIHFSGTRKKEKDARIVKSSLAEFARGGRVSCRAAPKNDAHAAAVCRRAEEYYSHGSNGFDGKYSLAFRNCEDFAVRCYEVEY